MIVFKIQTLIFTTPVFPKPFLIPLLPPNKKGSLVAGKDADIVIFDEDVNIKTTIINGRIVFNQAD
jgi:hypothetical protein